VAVVAGLRAGAALILLRLEAFRGGAGDRFIEGTPRWILALVFPTCALMHAVFILYAGAGQYALDPHGFVIGWAGVPGGLYFLWVVRRLYHEGLRDWNDAPAPAVAA
jgi:hypothetical protein